MNKAGSIFLLLTLVFYLGFSQGFSQNTPLKYAFEINSGVAYKNTLPFWMTANKFGAVPNSNYGLVYATVFSDFKASESDFKFAYKAGFTGTVASENDLFINELYGSVQFRKWQLDLGAKNDNLMWEGLSASNGNIIKSNNTRAFPGISLHTADYITLPFAKKWLRIKGNYAEYFLIDKRVVAQERLHHKNLYVKFLLSEKLSAVAGLDHYVQWGGNCDEYGKLPSGITDYLRIISGGPGGDNSEVFEQNNALGNHVGAHLFQVNYTGEKTNWHFYWSHPFEDRPGLELANYPDALYGVFVDLKKPSGFITHLLAEFYYTKHQGRSKSMPYFSENYFNGMIYCSGWTYFGNTMGAPFFRTKTPVNGITEGIDRNYSRFTAYHLGFKGFLNEHLQYKTYCSYVYYPGWFGTPINKEQFSSYVEFYLQPKKIPFEIVAGAGADFGSVLPKNFGGYLQLRFPLND
jgi:hypothetical protein